MALRLLSLPFVIHLLGFRHARLVDEWRWRPLGDTNQRELQAKAAKAKVFSKKLKEIPSTTSGRLKSLCTDTALVALKVMTTLVSVPHFFGIISRNQFNNAIHTADQRFLSLSSIHFTLTSSHTSQSPPSHSASHLMTRRPRPP